jgi:surfeit locus 1 family protein
MRSAVTIGIIALTVAAVCVRLGFWQVDRLDQRRDRNSVALAALDRPPITLNPAAARAISATPGDFTYRRAVIEGEMLTDRQVVWRGRSLAGRPGVNLLAPMRIVGSDAVALVNRGWVPSDDAATVEPRHLEAAPPTSLRGLLVPFAGPDADPWLVTNGSAASVGTPSLAALREATRLPLLPLYLQLVADSTSAPDDTEPPIALPLPDLGDEGPHLMYAVQWFGFAAVAMGGCLVLLWRARRSDSND